MKVGKALCLWTLVGFGLCAFTATGAEPTSDKKTKEAKGEASQDKPTKEVLAIVGGDNHRVRSASRSAGIDRAADHSCGVDR